MIALPSVHRFSPFAERAVPRPLTIPSDRFRKSQIPGCQGCRGCHRCRGALPAIARTNEFGASARLAATSLASQTSTRRPGPRFLLTIKNGAINLQVEFISPAIGRILVRRQRRTSPSNLRARREFAELLTSLAQGRSFQNVGDRPLVVVTAARDALAGIAAAAGHHGHAVDEQQPPCAAVHA
jgi:hypothetical protein